jgi:NitT/TauT family transport system substrate-binding protein
MVTIAKSANADLKVALDLTAEWEKVNGKNSLAQGCIVVRSEWAKKNPNELAKFLEEYKASVEFTTANPKEASEMIVATGVFAGKAPVAEKAIPKCNIVYIDGDAMAAPLDTFFAKIFEIAPASIGGKLPDSGIYYKK